MPTVVTTPDTTRRKLQRAAPLKVIPNPYHALDHQGRPAGVARRDPRHSAGNRLYIGAELGEVIVLLERSKGEISAGLAPTRQVNIWNFKTDAATDIEDTDYHRDLLRQGVLFAADKPTHVAVFGPSPKHAWTEPKLALSKSRAHAIQRWKDEHAEQEPLFVQEEAEAAAQAPSGGSPGGTAPAPATTSSAPAAPSPAPTTSTPATSGTAKS